LNRVLWCISVFFIGSLLFAAPINEITPDSIFKNDSISAYGYRKAYILPELNPTILKTSKEVSEMLPAGPYYYIVQLNDGSAARTGWLYITY